MNRPRRSRPTEGVPPAAGTGAEPRATPSGASNAWSVLRRRAERVLCDSPPAVSDEHVHDVGRLLHELAVHQTELEVQNEELLRIRSELETARDRYFDLFDAAPVGYLTLDPQTLIREANLAAAAMLGRPRRGLFNRRLGAFLAPQSRDAFYLLRHGLDELHAERCAELTLLRPDQTTLEVSVRLNAEVSSPGPHRRIRLVLMDITERKRVEGELLRREAEVAHLARVHTMAEMVGGVAHELSQPLTAIGSYAQGALYLLRKGPESDSRMWEALDGIREQSVRAAEAIHHLRALLRREPPKYAALKLNDLVREIADFIGLDARHHGSPFDLQLDGRVGEVMADRFQIQQVLLNLARNALEAMSATDRRERMLRVRTEGTSAAEARVSVEDRGPGLPPEIEAHLFMPFHTTKPNGLGLGLSLSRSLIQAHGGRMWVEPNPVGGVIFRFALPAVAPRPGAVSHADCA